MAVVIAWKLIKPAKLREKEFRLEFLNEMRKAAGDIRRDFQKTTRTWEHQVKFDSQISLKAPGPEVMVGTDDQIYRWVNEGTHVGKGRYPIWAGIYTGRSRAKALRFHSTFRAKTRPRYIMSYRGYVGGKVLYRPYVLHPGIKPRQFDEVLQKRWTPLFRRRMEAAMRRVVAKSGHAMR